MWRLLPLDNYGLGWPNTKMKRPIRIYQYQPFNVRTLANLKGRHLWYSKVARFNDPFELAYVIEQDLADDDVDYIYARLRDNQVKQKGASALAEWDSAYMTKGIINDKFREGILQGTVNALVKQKLNEGGVSCLAEANDDILMWAHYADGHRGFCLEFDTSFEPFSKLHQVKYQPQIPTFNPVRVFQDAEEFMKIFTTKFTAWKYEKEWRLLHKKGDTGYRYGVEALTGIYLGSAMEEAHKDVVLHLLHGSPTKFYKVNRSPTTFAISIEPIEYAPYDYATRPDARSTPAPD